MTPKSNLYDKFAAIVQSCTSDTAVDILRQYATSSLPEDEISNQCKCESNTWKLLELMKEAENKSTIYKYALLKEWVAKTSIHSESLDKIQNQHTIDKIEDGPSKKIRRISANAEKERQCKTMFLKLRSNNLDNIRPTTDQDTMLVHLYNGYVKYSNAALGDCDLNYTKAEREVWHDCVRQESKNKLGGINEKILYLTLSGNTEELCKAIGNTWEDVVWAYFNEQLESAMDNHDKLCSDSLISKDIAELALDKDRTIEKNNPKRFFHQMQIAILSDKVQDLIKKLYDGFINNTWNLELEIGNDHLFRGQVLRFVATLILFGREYQGWRADVHSSGLLSLYAIFNAEPATFNPKVIASYAKKLDLPDQITIFSTFLINFDGDDSEREIIVRLAVEHNLHIEDILRATSRELIEKARKSVPVSNKAKNSFEIQEEVIEEYALFFQAIKWLLLYRGTLLDAFQSANEIICYFLSVKKIYLVRCIINLFTDSDLEATITGSNPLAVSDIAEFDLHKRLVCAILNFIDWKNLLQNKPIDNGSYNDFQNIISWRNSVELQAVRIDNDMNTFLEADWLGKAYKERQFTTKSALRQIYIPELLIQYHHLLLASSEIIPLNREKSQNMSMYVICQYQELFSEIVMANRMEDVLLEFSKSLPHF